MYGSSGANMAARMAAFALVGRRGKDKGTFTLPVRGAEVFGEHHNYPRTWEEFIGQEDAKFQLQVAIASAKRRQEPIDHILLEAGRGGIGKTALALLVAAEADTDFVQLSGRLSAGDLTRAMVPMHDFGILFIDEIHRVAEQRDRGQFLLDYLQGGRLFSNGTQVLVSPKLTVIGATTEAGKLVEPLRQRFPIRPFLRPYTVEEAERICYELAGKVGFGTLVSPVCDPLWYSAIAEAADRIPRRMTAILQAVRDLALATNNANYLDGGYYDLETPLHWVGVRYDGLTYQACEYLTTMLNVYGGGPAGETAMVRTMRAPGGLTEAEQQLVDRQLIAMTAQGRQLTDQGRRYAVRLLAEKDDD